jgi:hypothetical protein
MSGPTKRRPVAPAEATQSLQALDVVEIEELQPKAPEGTPQPRKVSTLSNPSIAPVGLDLAASGKAKDDDANSTMQVRVPLRQKRLKGIVIGAVAGCLVILLAAGIARIGHAVAEPSAEAHPAVPATTTAAAAASPVPASAPATTTASTSTAAPATAGATTASGGSGDVPSTGTVRLGQPSLKGHVWLDGKKLTSSSALVSCGTHQVKVGMKRAHSIDVPCGGEIAVSK